MRFSVEGWWWLGCDGWVCCGGLSEKFSFIAFGSDYINKLGDGDDGILDLAYFSDDGNGGMRVRWFFICVGDVSVAVGERWTVWVKHWSWCRWRGVFFIESILPPLYLRTKMNCINLRDQNKKVHPPNLVGTQPVSNPKTTCSQISCCRVSFHIGWSQHCSPLLIALVKLAYHAPIF